MGLESCQRISRVRNRIAGIRYAVWGRQGIIISQTQISRVSITALIWLTTILYHNPLIPVLWLRSALQNSSKPHAFCSPGHSPIFQLAQTSELLCLWATGISRKSEAVGDVHFGILGFGPVIPCIAFPISLSDLPTLYVTSREQPFYVKIHAVYSTGWR